MSGERRRFVLAALGALIRGRYALRNGHRPPAGHTVPVDFTGVGIAPTADPVLQPALLAHLAALGVRHVRLDFTPADLNPAAPTPAMHLLEAVLEAGYRVCLHVLQSAEAARRMPGPAEADWEAFLEAALQRYGTRIDSLEATSTVNRARWAGYTLPGLLAAWRIAHAAARRHGVRLAGPSVTDFEPFFNVGLFALLRDADVLPDLHADNLFAERSTEPERWDHKILGAYLPPALLHFNLIKKARLLARIGAEAGVPHMISPAAFWTLPRIERQLPDSEQKQADYLSRYFVLCAASGALERASWGPLACHREGLLDNGAEPYPTLERITHYADVGGDALRVRPAFLAFAAFNRMIPGHRYEGRLNHGDGLEIHAFSDAEQITHAVWTMNGRAAVLPDLYSPECLANARIVDRDGQRLSGTAAGNSELATLVVTESPLYLCWPRTQPPQVLADAAPMSGLAVHAHAPGRHYYFRNATWHGMVRAEDGPAADTLIRALDPTTLRSPAKAETLRHARNAIWQIPDPRPTEALTVGSPLTGKYLVVKQPVKHHLHKKLLDRLKPSKARRSWNGACELLRRGVDTAAPVAWLEARDGRDLRHNWYVCDFVPGQLSVGSLFATYARGADSPLGMSRDRAYTALAAFILRMHNRGVFFRDLSGGNILIRQGSDGTFKFSLIDTARLRIHSGGLPLAQRLSDLTRACHKLDEAGRMDFLAVYLAALNKKVSGSMQRRFALYDLKARLKRRLRKTAFYKQLKR